MSGLRQEPDGLLDLLAGEYRIARLLGRGGIGSVYEVHHERMDRRQALKVINPELVDNPDALLRFEQEIKA